LRNGTTLPFCAAQDNRKVIYPTSMRIGDLAAIVIAIVCRLETFAGMADRQLGNMRWHP